ncbi:hypothetical protein BJX61DRAFT_436763 [Aspergillus egyptiacus]|nr:hypothetical protein BJX61DRAFT_436763 [Aspergillus egyptiacus]
MPRRTRPVEYEDLIDDLEYGMYTNRTKGEPLLDRSSRYSHRPPKAPVVELTERRVQGGAKPEISRESYEYLRDDDKVARRLAKLHVDDYARERMDVYMPKRRTANRAAGRLRPRIPEESSSSSESDEEYSDSESDEAVEVVRRPKRAVSRQRSASVKERRRVHLSKYDAEDYPKNPRSREDYAGGRKSSQYDTVPRARRRSHYRIDLPEEDDESDTSEEEVVPRHDRRRVSRKDHVKQKYSARAREPSISPSSPSSSSATSSESEIPEIPLPVPMSSTYKESSRRRKSISNGKQPERAAPPVAHGLVPTAYQVPSPPRVPRLEPVLDEREARHRKRMEQAVNEDIEIEKRSKESFKLSRGRRKEDPVVIEEKGKGRSGPKRSKKRDIMEEDYYQMRDPEPPSGKSSPSENMEGWAIVQAPMTKYTEEKEVMDIREERRAPRRRHRTKTVEREDLDSGLAGDPPRGKVGRRHMPVKDHQDHLWTEITKSLVVREALEFAGYEYEETEWHYYIYSCLHPDDVTALIEHSDDIRRTQRRRTKQTRRASLPPPTTRRGPSRAAAVLPLEPAPSPPRQPQAPSPPRLPQLPSPPRRPRKERRRREREEEFEEAYWNPRPVRW